MHFADNAGSDQPAHKHDQGLHGPVTDQWILQYMSMNRECSDQTTRMRMLIWTNVVNKLYKGHFHVLCI